MKNPPEYYVGEYCDVKVPAQPERVTNGIRYGARGPYKAERCQIVGVAGDDFVVNIGYSITNTILVPAKTLRVYRIVKAKKYLE